ncbi:SIR2 family protein [Chitinophaga sancti]|uniref:NAD(+) hydrolase ThsA n=1 Tax=Chitinophaga sancti TaxID=1004 RepID=A0A1K1LLR2_9BACT|nr:SIR2 family protein [Chitinophaga sancti]WQD65044.1 SIR2 family protein [Chitinophaga sancti]WQG89332.1 SIR2 family protein [Chitinophaga sancti]SFW11787.1 SIR2-like domain-containing protein [Chitinophaga sancti]
MKFSNEIEAFIKIFVKDLAESNVAIFAGAGLSKSAGYVDWPGLLKDIADELGLSVDKEHDLISLAQYHENEKQNRNGINRKILEEFSEQAEETENHRILARLPITTFWTTNYDTLIEDALKLACKVVDIKHELKQLATTRPKRDAVVYKMHGDVSHPADAVITKSQYEYYYKTHEPFITALSGDLISKTFLFLGFSFTDPNLDYILSRLNHQMGKNGKQHYCFMRAVARAKDEDEEIYKYRIRKQNLMINDLKRYKIETLLVERFEDITEVLTEIERRYRMKTIFISGSAEEYGSWDKNRSQGFIHLLSKRIILENYRIVNGFGWGVGSAVINGALEAIYEKPEKYSESQLIMRPFPQFKTGTTELPALWEDYRQKMISMAGISIIIFGNKKNNDDAIINAGGVKREFEIALEQGLVPIPVAVTGYMAAEIYATVMGDSGRYYQGIEQIIPLMKELSNDRLTDGALIDKIIKIVQTINK